MSTSARVVVVLVGVYQRLRAGRPSPCRYVPSCSEYAREAVGLHGAARGTWMTAGRLARCHPWGGLGYDPVPDRGARRGPASENADPVGSAAREAPATSRSRAARSEATPSEAISAAREAPATSPGRAARSEPRRATQSEAV